MNDRWKRTKFLLVHYLNGIRKKKCHDIEIAFAYNNANSMRLTNLTDYQKWIFSQLQAIGGLPKFKWDYGFTTENDIPEGRVWVWGIPTRGSRAKDMMPLHLVWDKAHDLGLSGMQMPGTHPREIFYKIMLHKQQPIAENLIKNIAIYCPRSE